MSKNIDSESNFWKKCCKYFIIVWCVFSTFLLLKHANNPTCIVVENVPNVVQFHKQDQNTKVNNANTNVYNENAKVYNRNTKVYNPTNDYVNKNAENLNKNDEIKMKYIIYENDFFGKADFNFGFGRDGFIKNNCSSTNCYATNNKSMVSKNEFGAIIVHGPTFSGDYGSLCQNHGHDNIVFLSLEGPAKFPSFIDHPNCINMSITYRLDDDIPMPYFAIYDSNQKFIAPMLYPLWKSPDFDEEFLSKYQQVFRSKKKPVAWFVSNCNYVFNNRNLYAKDLQKYIDVDIYGDCGTLKCPLDNHTCNEILKNDYFFYLSFENSDCVDYVTEKLLTPMEYDAIPVVMNGADMTRFAPPHSFLDVKAFSSPMKLAERIKFLMSNSTEYLKYFWWKKEYSYRASLSTHPFCTLCEILQDEKRKPKWYEDYSSWREGSNGNHICKSGYISKEHK